MTRALERLAARPRSNLALVTVYAFATIALHERVNQAVRALQQRLGPGPFLALVAGVAAALLLLLARAIARRPSPRRARLVFALVLWVAAAALAWRYLFTVASEGVHFPQYAVLAILFFPLAGRIGAAMLAANLVGVLDEANQYWVLHPDWGIYLDWNDIVLNALGALLGGLLLAAAGVEEAAQARHRRRAGRLSAPFVVTALLLALGSLLVAAGRIALRTPSGRPLPASTWLVLDRGDTRAQPFWVTAEWAQKRYHVLQSEGGAALVAAFALLALAVDRRGGGEPGGE
jgi:hypothetical protein